MKFIVLWPVAVLLAIFHVPVQADEWTTFQNGGKPAGSESLPVSWNESDGIAWSTTIAGYGQSSPVIFDENIYCTSVSGANKDDCHVMCFDMASGQQRWKYNLKNSSPEESSSYVSRAAPTPACDAQGVIAFFEGGNVVALDPTGNLRWQRDLVADYGPIKARHGLGASLEQNEECVFVWVERAEDPYVLALNKETGKTVWKSEGMGSTSWSSPRLVPVGENSHLVLSSIGKLAGYDIATGVRLWSFENISGNSTPTPIPVGQGRFLIGATTGRGESSQGNAAESNGVIEITQADDGSFAAAYLWQAERATSSFGSPLAFAGHAYFVNRTGVVYCLDLNTGQEIFAQRTDGSTWATPIGCGNHVYLFGKNGITTVIESGSKFKLVSENRLWSEEKTATDGERGASFGGEVLYAAAVADSGIILRRGDRLYRITK